MVIYLEDPTTRREPCHRQIVSAKQLQLVLEELVQAANQICQFSQRETDLNAERFVQTLVLGWLRQTEASLNELA